MGCRAVRRQSIYRRVFPVEIVALMPHFKGEETVGHRAYIHSAGQHPVVCRVPHRVYDL